MAESRHRTVLEVGVDDREVRGLGATMDRAFNPKTIDAFERSLERTSRTMAKLVEQQTRLSQVLDRMDQRARQQAQSQRAAGGSQRAPGGGGGGSGRQTSFGAQAGATALGSYAGNVMAQAAQGSGAVATAAGAIPIVGPFLAGAVQGVNSFYQSHVQRMMARTGAFGQTGLSRPGFGLAERWGARMGMMPGQSIGMTATMGQQTGMVGPELLQAMGTTAGGGSLMTLGQLMGFRNLGSVFGAAGAAGGQGSFGMSDTVQDAVRTGVISGFREGRLDQFFAQFAGWLDQIRTGGIPLDVGSALQLTRGVSLIGQSFRGEAGMRAAQGFQQAITGAGRQSGPAAMMMLRAAGMTGGSFGDRSFMEARAFAEQNPAAVMQNFMTMFQRMAGSATPGQAALFAEQAFQSLGMQMSATQALDFAQAAMGDVGGDRFAITPEGAAAATEDQVSAMIARRQAAAGGRGVGGGVVQDAAGEAQYQLARAGVGARVAGAARAIRNVELALAQSLLPSINHFAGYLNTAAGYIRRGDWAGLATHAVSPITGASQQAGGTAFDAAQQSASDLQRIMRENPVAVRALRLAQPALGPVLDGLMGLDATGDVRTNQRGITPGSEQQNLEMERLEREGAGALERRQRLQEMQQAESEGDPISMIIQGARQIAAGAERLEERLLPGESDMVPA